LPAAVIWPVKKRPKLLAASTIRAVTGDVGHRRQGVELLRAGDPRHGVHGDHGGPAGGKLVEQLLVLRGVDEADEGAALAQQRDLLGAGRSHLEDDVRRGPEAARVGCDLAADIGVCDVDELRGGAGSGFDDDVEAEALEALCGVRGGSHPALAWVDLLRDADLHVREPAGPWSIPRAGPMDIMSARGVHTPRSAYSGRGRDV
jgi:hypothetical protein